MAKLALLLIAVLFVLRVLLVVKFKREPSAMTASRSRVQPDTADLPISKEAEARRFRLSTLQVLLVLAIIGAHSLFGALIASIVLLCGLAGIVFLSFLPTRNRPE